MLLLTSSNSAANRTLISENSTAPIPDPICKPGCITAIDYQSPDTPLIFSRTYNASGSDLQTLRSRWRHRYEIRLTRQGNDRMIFDHHGNRHLFKLGTDGKYRSQSVTSGSLRREDDQYLWTDGNEIQHRFYGSFPVSLQFPDKQRLTLHYQNGQLESVTDEASNKISLTQEGTSLKTALLPDGQLLDFAGDPCPPDSRPVTEEAPERCDTQANPVPGFPPALSGPGMTTLDARPASCQSYFVDYYGTVRGEEIEAGLEQHPPYSSMVPTNRSFPIIDFVDGNELVVVRSRDLASPTYNQPASPDALYDRLMQDGAQIQERALEPLETDGFLYGTESGRTTLITHDEEQSVVLHLVIRQGMASASHWQQIANARATLAERYGIRLLVVIIP